MIWSGLGAAPSLPEGYVARPATLADAAEATRLENAVEIADWGGGDEVTEAEMRDEWESGPDLQSRVTLVFSSEHELAAMIRFDDNGDGHFEADGYVHPAHIGLGLGTWLIRTSERLAWERRADLPGGARPRMRSFTSGSNAGAMHLLAHEGYSPIRHFWRMAIDLDQALPAPEWPEGLVVRACREGIDERAIWEAGNEAFVDHFEVGPEPDFDAWLAMRKRNFWDPGLWQVVWDGDEIAAICLSRMTGEGLGWVSKLAVRAAWRRRGLGRALLLDAFRRFQERGVPSVALGVDSGNDYGATVLYEAAGMRVTRSYVLHEKMLAG
jgi:mycothiol synthase